MPVEEVRQQLLLARQRVQRMEAATKRQKDAEVTQIKAEADRKVALAEAGATLARERRLALALGKRVTVTRRAQALRLDPPSL